MNILALMQERSGDYDCPRCRRSLRGCRLALLREDEPQYTVQVTCATCDITFVVVLQVRDRSDELESAASTRTDGAETGAPPIAADELLELHEALARHRGPLSELISGAAGR